MKAVSKLCSRLVLAMLAGLVVACPQAGHGQGALEELYSFPKQTLPGLMLKPGLNGNFYGIAAREVLTPSTQRSWIYRLSPEGKFTELQAFPHQVPWNQPVVGDGAVAQDDIVIGRDGTVYGSTRFGGAYGNGILFSLSAGGTYTVLHEFRERVHARLQFQDENGDLYGIADEYAPEGMLHNSVFKFTPDGVLTIVRSFRAWGVPPGTAPGETEPSAITMIFRGRDGKIYGTSLHGGMYGLDPQTQSMQSFGSVFRLEDNGSMDVIFRGDLIRKGFGQILPAPDGSFYCLSGNAVIRVTLQGEVTTVAEFTPGSWPFRLTQLILAPDGNLYGLGETVNQVLFKLTPGGKSTILAEFPRNTSQVALAAGNDDYVYVVSVSRSEAPVGKPPRYSFYRLKISNSLEGNRPPVTKADIRLLKRTPYAIPGVIRIPVLVNDQDADKEDLTITGIRPPRNGRAWATADGKSLMYAPGASPQTEQFSYICSDSRGGTAEGQVLIRRRASGRFNVVLRDYTGTARGSLSVVMNAYGKFTAKVVLDGQARKVKGNLSKEDSYQTILPLGDGKHARLQFALDPTGTHRLKTDVEFIR